MLLWGHSALVKAIHAKPFSVRHSELHPRRTFEQAIVSQHLRSGSGKADQKKNRVVKLGVEEGVSKKKKKGRRVGPVTVQVLANIQEDRLSGACG